MRINLTKKDLVNLVYMQLGFSKQISENLIDDFLSTIVSNIKSEKKLKLSKFGTFSIRQKKSRIGRNPKTKETKVVSCLLYTSPSPRDEALSRMPSSA